LRWFLFVAKSKEFTNKKKCWYVPKKCSLLLPARFSH
jgi:hypothetical protein